MMGYSFDPYIEETLVYTFLGLFLVILITIEVFRKKRDRLAIRIVVSIILIFSLAMIVLRPGSTRNVVSPDALIITEDADLSIVDSIRRTKSDIFFYNDSLKDVQIPEFLNEFYTNVHIVGNGLGQWDVARMNNVSLNFYPPRPGIISNLSFDPFCYTEETTTISFNYHSSEIDTISALIKGQGNTLDSLQFVTSVGKNKVNLNFKPQTEGDLIYTLKVSSKSDSVSEKLGIRVIKRAPVKVLISNEYPSFELKYLKDQLKDEGIPVVSRFKVGRNNYSTEFANINRSPVKVLNDKTLEQFDVLVTTASSFYSLNQYENSVIKRNVEAGLGLILLLDEGIKDEFPFNGVRLQVFDKSDYDVTYSDSEKKLKTTNKRIDSSTKLFPILISNDNEILSGYIVRRLGKAGFVNLTNMFTLKLQGENESYTNLITQLIDGVRRRTQNQSWSFEPLPLIEGIPIKVKLTTNNKDPRLIITNSSGQQEEVFLTQSIWDDFLWEADYTPTSSGWHSVMNKQDSTSQSRYYVCDSDAWSSVIKSRYINSNEVASFTSQNEVDSKFLTKYSKVNPWIWFIIFTLCAGFMWLESKL